VRIVVGSDHAGFSLKEHVRALLERQGHAVVDVGTFSTESTDYPDWGRAVAERVVTLEADAVGEPVRGVAICGSGIGIAIAANKVQGARAALAHDATTAKLSRQHNDANIICFGERITGRAVVEEALRAFLETPFEGGRHALRVEKLNKLGPT
jgi:ribose 5-phosphate isomerase B